MDILSTQCDKSQTLSHVNCYDCNHITVSPPGDPEGMGGGAKESIKRQELAGQRGRTRTEKAEVDNN